MKLSNQVQSEQGSSVKQNFLGDPDVGKNGQQIFGNKHWVDVLKGTTLGKLVAKSINVRVYWWPSEDKRERGPTRSMENCENSSVMKGIGFKGAAQILPLAENPCHLQDRQKGRISAPIHGQKKRLVTFICFLVREMTSKGTHSQ